LCFILPTLCVQVGEFFTTRAFPGPGAKSPLAPLSSGLSNSIAHHPKWDMHTDLCNSNYYPVQILISKQKNIEGLQNGYLKKHTGPNIPEPLHHIFWLQLIGTQIMDSFIHGFTDYILQAGIQSILQTSDIIRQWNIPCRNHDIKTANLALRTFRQTRQQKETSSIQKNHKNQQKQSWNQFLISITKDTDPSFMCPKMKILSNSKPPLLTFTLLNGG